MFYFYVGHHPIPDGLAGCFTNDLYFTEVLHMLMMTNKSPLFIQIMINNNDQ